MEEYTKWCDSESNAKEDAITSGKRTVKDLQAAISEASASIQSLTSETEELAAKIASVPAPCRGRDRVRTDELVLDTFSIGFLRSIRTCQASRRGGRALRVPDEGFRLAVWVRCLRPD